VIQLARRKRWLNYSSKKIKSLDFLFGDFVSLNCYCFMQQN
jgi:hypothetical protein